jgi:hypothetical protein
VPAELAHQFGALVVQLQVLDLLGRLLRLEDALVVLETQRQVLEDAETLGALRE